MKRTIKFTLDRSEIQAVVTDYLAEATGLPGPYTIEINPDNITAITDDNVRRIKNNRTP